jgi:hypothetical protein
VNPRKETSTERAGGGKNSGRKLDQDRAQLAQHDPWAQKNKNTETMHTYRKTKLESSLRMRAENEAKQRANRRPTRNRIQPQPQEKEQARTGKSLRFDGSKYEPRRSLRPDPKCEHGKMGITNSTQQHVKTNFFDCFSNYN